MKTNNTFSSVSLQPKTKHFGDLCLTLLQSLTIVDLIEIQHDLIIQKLKLNICTPFLT